MRDRFLVFRRILAYCATQDNRRFIKPGVMFPDMHAGVRGLPLYFTGDGPHEVAGLDLLHGAGMPLSSRMST